MTKNIAINQPVASYVFFDLETTGLPHEERNRTTITELSFIAVSRHDFERATTKNLPVMSKLVINYNPRRIISTRASEMTGLTNDLLKNSPTFSQRTKTVLAFFDDLPKPICLIAHNGNRFDFKLLNNEFIDANESLPNDILCVDSLAAFKKILPHYELDSDDTIDNITSDEDDWPDMNITPEDWDSIDKLCSSFESVTCNTPKLRKVSSTNKNSFKDYKLDSLYRALLKKEPTCSHRAEHDCYALIECTLAIRKQFVNFVDVHTKKLCDIKPFNRY